MVSRLTCAVGTLALLLAGCSLNPFAEKSTDYRSAGRGPALDVPPDLTRPRYDERYRAPGASGPGQVVLPKVDSVRIERSGNERWLVVNQPAETVWPIIRAFWQELGFVLVTDRPEAGVMETDWLESRSRVGADPVRNVLARVLSGFASSGLRDKYRVRIERGADNSTEIYLSHRGLEEVPVGGVRQGEPERFAWAPRNSDPNLEAEMLQRLLVRLGLPAAQAQQAAAAARPTATRVSATSQPATPTGTSLGVRARLHGSVLEVDDPFDRAWRRVGLALDRVGFTVVDRDRTQGTYFVRYADDGSASTNEGGWVDRLKFWKSDEPPPAEQYRVFIKETDGKSIVVVQDKLGAATPKALSDRILGLLLEQLK